MRLKPLFIFIVLFTVSYSIFSQESSVATWYFGNYAGLNFANDTVVELIDGQLSTGEGCTVVSDPYSDTLLFYSDGRTVWNKWHEVIENGNALGGHSSSTQSVIAVPMPDHLYTYYLFTTDGHGGRTGYSSESNGTGYFSYSILDMSKNNGHGKVTQKQSILFLSSSEKVAAVQHCNGKDYWIVGHSLNDNKFHVYQLTGSGLSNAVITEIGTPHEYLLKSSGADSISGFSGVMKFSPDGTKIATCLITESLNKLGIVELFDFNNSTGELSNTLTIDSFLFPYGLSFSPNSKILYVSEQRWQSSRLLQLDVSSWDKNLIKASVYELFKGGVEDEYYLGQIQQALDGKLYVAKTFSNSFNDTSFLGVITSPNTLGSACGYLDRGVTLSDGHNSTAGLPNYVESDFFEPINAGDEDTVNVCLGDTVVLGGQPTGPDDVSYQWMPNISLSNDTVKNPIAFPDSSVWYQVTYSTVNGCVQRVDSVFLNVSAAEISLADKYEICEGDSITIGNIDNSPSWGTYLWLPSGQTTPFITISPDSSSLYTIVISSLDCKHYTDTVDSTFIWVHDAPTLEMRGNYAVCAGSDLIIGPEAIDSNYNYSWDPITYLSSNTVPNPLFHTNEHTTSLLDYTLTITDSNQCTVEDVIYIMIHPTPEVDAGKDQIIIKNTATDLMGIVSEYDMLYWNPEYLVDNKNAIETNTVPLSKSTLFSLTTITDSGCIAMDTVLIEVIEEPVIDLPKAFTPNGDGLNDLLTINRLVVNELEYWKIFDKWGNLIFETDNLTDGWDGTSKGVIQETGTYPYMLSGRFKAVDKDISVVKHGMVTLLR